MTTIKNMIARIMHCVIDRLLVPAAFPILRLMKDQLFLHRLASDALKPSRLAAPLIICARAWLYFARSYRHAFDDYALRRYSRFVKHHYSKNGRGYFSYEKLSDADKITLYGEPDGRVRDFIDTYGDLLEYADGDSFFDAGCGRGQNVKVLRERFPHSPILAKDISAEAVKVIDLAAASPLLTTGTLDLSDPAALADIGDGAYDHVVISHVLSVILGEGLQATRGLRQRIISDLVRIAGKSLLIIDSPAIIAAQESFEIEQKDRGWFSGSVWSCFAESDGRIMTLHSGGSVAILYRPAADNT